VQPIYSISLFLQSERLKLPARVTGSLYEIEDLDGSA